MTTKWDELVEAAARGNWHRSEWDVEPWEEVPEEIKRHVRAGMDAALRALLAKGYVIVPGEPTVEMIKAWGDSFWRGDNQGERITAALSAGSIKPPAQGEG